MTDPTKDDIPGKLIRSAMVKSLTQEIRVMQAFRDLAWHTTIGPVYTDRSERKLREVDVDAWLPYWKRGTIGPLLSSLHILVEVKTMMGFHVIVTESAEKVNFRCYGLRVRLDDIRQAEIEAFNARLVAAGVPERIVNILLRDYRDNIIIEQLGAELDALEPDVPPATTTSSTFREGNPGNEKDESSSVLWRASRTLFSAIDSFRATCVEGRMEDVITRAELTYGVLRDQYPEVVSRHVRSPEKELSDAYLTEVARAVFVHPLIVTDAKLWKLEGDNRLTSIESFRLIRHALGSDELPWIDVVTSDKVIDFLKELDSCYRGQLLQRGFNTGPLHPK